MDEIIDKIILLGFGFVLLLDSTKASAPVVALLVAIMAAALGIYIEERRLFYFLQAVVFLLALKEPCIISFFPVLFYDMAYRKSCVVSVPFFLLFALYLPEETWQIVLWLFMAALSVILAYKTEKKQHLAEELIRIRDSGEEIKLVLKEKNRTLLKKQDYEIHLATLKERNRIAREIHDNVGHLLSRALLMTGALLTIEKEGAAHEQLLNIKGTLDLAMNSIRQSVHGLYDESIDLRQSINEIIKPMKQTYDVRLEYDMSGEIPKCVKYCLIATAKEAVSNILKHSNGNWVQINLREHPAFYQISVEDNGTDIKREWNSGIGLQSMKERADALGGTFCVHTKMGFGIFMTIPKTEGNLCEQ